MTKAKDLKDGAAVTYQGRAYRVRGGAGVAQAPVGNNPGTVALFLVPTDLKAGENPNGRDVTVPPDTEF